MKALTVRQPYAELIARGDKPIENRRWATAYRGPLAIHAGLSRAWMDDEDEERYGSLTFGAVVAVADLVNCVHVKRLPFEFAHHPHANGPFCWILANVRRLHRAVPVRGAQGLWVPDATVLAQILAALCG